MRCCSRWTPWQGRAISPRNRQPTSQIPIQHTGSVLPMTASQAATPRWKKYLKLNSIRITLKCNVICYSHSKAIKKELWNCCPLLNVTHSLTQKRLNHDQHISIIEKFSAFLKVRQCEEKFDNHLRNMRDTLSITEPHLAQLLQLDSVGANVIEPDQEKQLLYVISIDIISLHFPGVLILYPCTFQVYWYYIVALSRCINIISLPFSQVYWYYILYFQFTQVYFWQHSKSPAMIGSFQFDC